MQKTIISSGIIDFIEKKKRKKKLAKQNYSSVLHQQQRHYTVVKMQIRNLLIERSSPRYTSATCDSLQNYVLYSKL